MVHYLINIQKEDKELGAKFVMFESQTLGAFLVKWGGCPRWRLMEGRPCGPQMGGVVLSGWAKAEWLPFPGL